MWKSESIREEILENSGTKLSFDGYQQKRATVSSVYFGFSVPVGQLTRMTMYRLAIKSYGGGLS